MSYSQSNDPKLDDLDILVTRAIENCPITVFGEDAGGFHYFQSFYSTIIAKARADGNSPVRRVFSTNELVAYAIDFRLMTVGHDGGSLLVDIDPVKLLGDRNLKIGLSKLLGNYSISNMAWSVSSVFHRCENCRLHLRLVFDLSQIVL